MIAYIFINIIPVHRKILFMYILNFLHIINDISHYKILHAVCRIVQVFHFLEKQYFKMHLVSMVKQLK